MSFNRLFLSSFKYLLSVPLSPELTLMPLPPQPGECWYNGTRTYTKSGRTCEKWDSDSVHYTEKVIRELFQRYKQPIDHNYCRLDFFCYQTLIRITRITSLHVININIAIFRPQVIKK